MTSVYLAGPIHHVDDDGRTWRQYVEEQTSISCINPLDYYDDSYQSWSDQQIIEQDLSLIDQADAVVVNWELVPMAGTPMEMFYANHVHDKPVVAAFDGAEDDLSPWVTGHSDVRQSIDDLVTAAESL